MSEVKPMSDDLLADLRDEEEPLMSAGEWLSLQARIDSLQAVVDKLPKTADGVPVVPGMNLYSPIVDYNFGCLSLNADNPDDIACRDERGVEFTLATCDVWSTREAADRDAAKAAQDAETQADERIAAAKQEANHIVATAQRDAEAARADRLEQARCGPLGGQRSFRRGSDGLHA